MQLEKLIVTDLGTFRGTHTFDLSPKKVKGHKHPVVLFGGLNGAGKTTLLTAIRLVLYGRHSMESGSTQKQYEQHLIDLIHRTANKSEIDKASITLEFAYARLGEKTRYKVVRSWGRHSRSVAESLNIYSNDAPPPILDGEQAQAFLNQLIPSGISQFFFFDGEKIASLAKDDSDLVLSDAIRRLLGLDLAERLQTDLSTYLRQRHAKSFGIEIQEEIRSIEDEVKRLESQIEKDLIRLSSDVSPALDEAVGEYERRKSELMDRGGAWAVDRKALEEKLETLNVARKEAEEHIREQLQSAAIFTLAPKVSAAAVEKLNAVQEQNEQRVLAKVLAQRAGLLKKKFVDLQATKELQNELHACVDEWLNEVYQVPQLSKAAYEASDAEIRDVKFGLTTSAPLARSELASAYAKLRRINDELEKIQETLAYAPAEGALAGAFNALEAAGKEVAGLEAERKLLIEEMRRNTWFSVDLTRKLRKLIAQANEDTQTNRANYLAESFQHLIDDFKILGAQEKCNQLKHYFLETFSRLARKSDVISGVEIDSETFVVRLLDQFGQELPKKRLSAGEKQIYAIAMLEALAKASGRSLPIIIDTPLGRLDSQHRQKLVESYFPYASHQVIILSTDTEVNPEFYRTLQPYISHAYHLEFDEEQGHSKVGEGYFWKELVEVHANAA